MPENQEMSRTRHSDDITDIISSEPPWALRWGNAVFFGVLLTVIALSAVIRFPDTVKTSLKINSPNSPKPLVSRVAGKLAKILVKEDALVQKDEPLAYLESTASHQEVLDLLEILKNAQGRVIRDGSFATDFREVSFNHLGEIQPAYQVFLDQYQEYRSTIDGGFYIKKKQFLKMDLSNLESQKSQLDNQKSIQLQDLKIADAEVEMHKRLERERVETPAELRQQESRYLSKKSPLVQTEGALLGASTNITGKRKELFELDNQIAQEKAKFLEALNSLISQMEDWKVKYVITAPQAGRVLYAGIVQENQFIEANQEVFYVNPQDEQFFGFMVIPQDNLGKVREGQTVLVKLHSYPFQEYGMLIGKVGRIADVPLKDSVFVSRVDFGKDGFSSLKKPIHLKTGMVADAEIVTQDATILQRIVRNLVKVIGH